MMLSFSFAIPKVLYALRTAPCFLSPDLQSFDETLCTILKSIVNVHIDNDSVWLQASLQVRAGGIGIRRSAQLAPSAHLASAAGCSELVHQILPPHLLDNPDFFETGLDLWREGIYPASCKQRNWDAPRIEVTFQLSFGVDKSAVPSMSPGNFPPRVWSLPQCSSVLPMGLRMDDNVIRIAVGLRLGLPLCRSHECSNCGAQIETFGPHGLSCWFSKGRHSRHASLNDIIKRSLDAAKIPPGAVWSLWQTAGWCIGGSMDKKENPGVGCYLCGYSGTIPHGTRGKRGRGYGR